MKPGNLNGLRNQGATCYMNSLLQTLFMTGEFRQELYSYRHTGPESDKLDSIPFQLQKLFLNLQYSRKVCSTRQLIKSFQWEDAQKFQQHDAQQFCRVLFDSIENSADNQWIHRMYAGTMKSFVRCDNGHSSERLQDFMDLSLTIKNPFENVEHHSVEQAIKGWLKPQRLEFGNKYQCEECGSKVEATKGLEFVSLPSILTIQLKRFELNYETMNREKINQFVYFPQLLEMGKFMRPYSEIQIDPIPKELEELRKSPRIQEAKKFQQSKAKLKEKIQKPSLKRKNSEERERNLEQVSFLDDLGLDKQKKQALTANQDRQQKIEQLNILKFNKEELDKKYQKIDFSAKNDKLKQTKQPKQTMEDIDNDILFGIGGAMIGQSDNWDQSKKASNPAIEYIHNEPTFDSTRTYPDNTYSLFAVLVHDGNAHHGHYYAYIKEGDKWYKFDDSQVTQANESQIRKYGDMFKFSQGANAYMLFYRNVKGIADQKPVEASAELVESIDQPQQKEDKNKQLSSNKYIPYQIRTFQRPFQVKLFYPPSVSTILRSATQSMTPQQLKELVRREFKIAEDDSNWRLRLYNSFQQVMLSPLEGCAKTMLQLNLTQTISLAIEFKSPTEVFEDYDPRLITLNLHTWREGLFYAAQNSIQPVKIKIRDDQTYQSLYQLIQEETGILNPIVLRRTFVGGNNTAQTLSLSDKSLLEMRFFNNLNLFVQEPSQNLKWQDEFDNQKYRVAVTYNYPVSSLEGQVRFDNRKSFRDLKLYISNQIGVHYTEFRVKMNTNSAQLTGNKRLSSVGIVGQVTLFLQLGRSIKNIINISKMQAVNTQTGVGFNKQDEKVYQIEITKTVLDLKSQIASQQSLTCENIRVRELKQSPGQIYKDNTVLDQLKDKVMCWQQVSEQSRGIQVYTRFYEAGKLSEYQQVFVQYDATYQQMALVLSQFYCINAEAVYGYSPTVAVSCVAELQTVHWSNINCVQGKVYEMPFYVSTDGVYLIVKQGTRKTYEPELRVGSNSPFTYGPSLGPDYCEEVLFWRHRKQGNLEEPGYQDASEEARR